MGDCGAPGSAVCWKVRGCVGACDGVAAAAVAAAAAAVVVVAANEEGGTSNTENQRLAEFCCKCLFFIQAQVTASRQVRHK